VKHRIYQASQIKRRRSTKAEVERRRRDLYVIVRAMHPMTVRQVFYQATVRSVVEKIRGRVHQSTDRFGADAPSRRIALRLACGQHSLAKKAAHLQWRPGSLKRDRSALSKSALWCDADAYVEVWLEKDALAGVVLPITAQYDVPLMVARGYASLSFLHSAAEFIGTLDVPTFIFHFGDFDPSGVKAGEKIEETLVWCLTQRDAEGTLKFISNASRYYHAKLMNGTCLLGPRNQPTLALGTLVIFQSSLMPLNRKCFVAWCRKQSNDICRRNNTEY
jgi:hypothetical protein